MLLHLSPVLGSGWQPAGQQLHCVDVPGDGADRVENRCERRRCALVLMPWAMRSPWHLKNSINSAAWQRYANQNWFWVSISSIIRIVLPLSLAYKGYSYKASISKEKEKKTNNTTHTKTLVPFVLSLWCYVPPKKERAVCSLMGCFGLPGSGFSGTWDKAVQLTAVCQ